MAEKYERKIDKLSNCIELELKERKQVDDVIEYFTE
jgi:hypothetical protein